MHIKVKAKRDDATCLSLVCSAYQSLLTIHELPSQQLVHTKAIAMLEHNDHINRTEFDKSFVTYFRIARWLEQDKRGIERTYCNP